MSQKIVKNEIKRSLGGWIPFCSICINVSFQILFLFIYLFLPIPGCFDHYCSVVHPEIYYCDVSVFFGLFVFQKALTFFRSEKNVLVFPLALLLIVCTFQ